MLWGSSLIYLFGCLRVRMFKKRRHIVADHQSSVKTYWCFRGSGGVNVGTIIGYNVGIS